VEGHTTKVEIKFTSLLLVDTSHTSDNETFVQRCKGILK